MTALTGHVTGALYHQLVVSLIGYTRGNPQVVSRTWLIFLSLIGLLGCRALLTRNGCRDLLCLACSGYRFDFLVTQPSTASYPGALGASSRDTRRGFWEECASGSGCEGSAWQILFRFLQESSGSCNFYYFAAFLGHSVGFSTWIVRIVLDKRLAVLLKMIGSFGWPLTSKHFKMSTTHMDDVNLAVEGLSLEGMKKCLVLNIFITDAHIIDSNSLISYFWLRKYGTAAFTALGTTHCL